MFDVVRLSTYYERCGKIMHQFLTIIFLIRQLNLGRVFIE